MKSFERPGSNPMPPSESKPLPPPNPSAPTEITGECSVISKNVVAHESIVALINEMPKPGTKWSRIRRRTWLTALEAICDYIYSENADE